MANKSKENIEIVQKDGIIYIYQNGELVEGYDFNDAFDRMTPVTTATWVANLLYGALFVDKSKIKLNLKTENSDIAQFSPSSYFELLESELNSNN